MILEAFLERALFLRESVAPASLSCPAPSKTIPRAVRPRSVGTPRVGIHAEGALHPSWVCSTCRCCAAFIRTVSRACVLLLAPVACRSVSDPTPFCHEAGGGGSLLLAAAAGQHARRSTRRHACRGARQSRSAAQLRTADVLNGGGAHRDRADGLSGGDILPLASQGTWWPLTERLSTHLALGHSPSASQLTSWQLTSWQLTSGGCCRVGGRLW